MSRLVSILLLLVLGVPSLARMPVGLPSGIEFVSPTCCAAADCDEGRESPVFTAACCCKPSPVAPSGEPQAFAFSSSGDVSALRPVVWSWQWTIQEPNVRAALVIKQSRGPPGAHSLLAQYTSLII